MVQSLSSGRVLLCCGGSAHHLALAAQLYERGLLHALVIEHRPPRRPKGWQRLPLLIDRLAARLLAPQLDRAWRTMLSEYAQRYPVLPPVPTLKVSNINAPEVLEFCQAQNPSLIVVSGTSLVRAPLLTMPLSIGMVNLHTGLSPYVKGGPNCTNWCLAEGRPELIGSTVMWIDAGIDTGSIITSAHPDLSHISSLLELHQTVMRHAHLLLLDAVQRITSSGKAAVPAVPQSNFPPGRTYYTREWTAQMRYRAVRNFLRGDLRHKAARPTPATVPIALSKESE